MPDTPAAEPPGPDAREPDDGGLTLGEARGRWVLAAAVLGSGIVSIDGTVVGIALPTIGRDFHADVASLQWVVTAYTLTLAGLLLVGGSLGDRYGRRRVFVLGTVWFAVASALCGVAPDAGTLIAARALQGVGGALLTPGSLAILEASFHPDHRGRAIGAWSGLGGVATAVGPFLGGWLVEAVSWRLIFAINLPLAAAVIALAVRHVPESRSGPLTGRVDAVGGALITLGLVGLVYGLIEGPARGWSSPGVTASLAVGAVLSTVFVGWERRAAAPMLPLSIFRSAQFTAANVVTFVVYAALGGVLFLLPIQLQTVAGYSPLAAGTALLPVTVIMLLFSSRSGALAARIGPRLQMTVGPLVVAGGLALLTRAADSGSYATRVLPAMIVFGCGLAINVAPLTATVLAAAPAENAGVASAVNNDVSRAAGLIAVAVLPSAAGIDSAATLDAQTFAAGFRTAVWICAALCVLGGALAAATIRNPPRRRPRPEAVPPAEQAGAEAPAEPARQPDLAECYHCGLAGPPQVRGTHPDR